ncbi:MAG: CinA family protein [Pontimonas sp.]|nr:CinA family protein [Pontimonas sp.]MDP4817164.1 CinA family protein [Pontimonas sp.]
MSEEAAAVIATASKLGLTVGCAESLTGGLVAAEIVSVPGASAVFRGSIVAYDSMLKNDLLGVDASTLASTGAVTAEVASAMAEGALARLGVDVAVATTGVAGPDPDPVSGEAPGAVFIAVAGGGLGTLVREMSLEGDRDEIRQRATRAALQALLDGLSTRE